MLRSRMTTAWVATMTMLLGLFLAPGASAQPVPAQGTRIQSLGGGVTQVASVDSRVTRLSGANTYDASAQISARNFAPGVPVVYVASGAKFQDALSGAPVAGRDGVPMLLTRPDVLEAVTVNELKRLRPGRIVVLGGPLTVSTAVESALKAYAYQEPVKTLRSVWGDGQVNLSWTNPVSASFDGVEIRRTEGPTPPANRSQGTRVATLDASYSSWSDAGTAWRTSPGKQYSYTVFARSSHLAWSVPQGTTVNAGYGNAELAGYRWSDPVKASGGIGFEWVRCPSASTCFARGTDGATYLWTAASKVWRADTSLHLTSLTCPTSNFCAGFTAENGYVTWNGSSWNRSREKTAPVSGSTRWALDCSSTSSCRSLEQPKGKTTVLSTRQINPSTGDGTAALVDVTTQAQLPSLDKYHPELACTSGDVCIGTFVNTGYSHAMAILVRGAPKKVVPLTVDVYSGGQNGTDATCTSTECMLKAQDGDLIRINGSGVDTIQPVSPLPAVALDCADGAAGMTCGGVARGHGLTWVNGRWDWAQPLADGESWSSTLQFTSVSCPTERFCMATNQYGDVATATR